MICLIGCGGVGSHALPVLLRLCKSGITVIDGDTLEKRNLDRQLFSKEHVGMNKAEALAAMFGCAFIPKYFDTGTVNPGPKDWLMVAADNHAARNDALSVCDGTGCRAIIMANESWSSEAYYYTRNWQGTALDPRQYYPEITEDRSGDPRAASIGCTGKAQQRTVQLVTANQMAAALGCHLYAIWELESPKLKRETLPRLPHHLINNLSSNEARCAANQQRTEP